MKVIIDIPDYNFDNDIADKFQDYFERVKADIADGTLCGNYELETTEMFLNAFKEMQVLPDNATNGDMIKTMFPEYEETRMCGDVRYGSKEYANLEFVVDEDWWDSPYKICNESMLPPNVRNVIDAIKNGQPLSRNTTNGDLVKAMFPNLDVRFDEEENIVDVGVPSGFTTYIPIAAEWWNALYRG